MVNPAALVIVGIVTGIGGAMTFATFDYVEKTIANGSLAMRTEEERKSSHERIFGKGSTPPSERLGRGQTVNDLLPMPPNRGLPLPRFLNIKWPWIKE